MCVGGDGAERGGREKGVVLLSLGYMLLNWEYGWAGRLLGGWVTTCMGDVAWWLEGYFPY